MLRELYSNSRSFSPQTQPAVFCDLSEMQGDGVSLDRTTIASTTLILGWVLTILAALSVLGLVLSCRARKSSQHYDDIFLYLSLVLSVVLMSLTSWAIVTQGQGQHEITESHSQLERVARSLLVNEIFWGVVNTLLRIYAILFLRRVFLMRVITTGLLLVSGLYVFVTITLALAICRPIATSWDQSIPGRCGNQKMAYLSVEIVAAIIDIAILIVPFPALVRLEIRRKSKLKIIALFSLGAVVFIITGLRIAALNRVNSHDFTYDQGYVGLLSILGPLVTIICCCMIPVWPFLASLFTNFVRACDISFSSTKHVWSRNSHLYSIRGDRRTYGIYLAQPTVKLERLDKNIKTGQSLSEDDSTSRGNQSISSIENQDQPLRPPRVLSMHERGSE
ncbi:hypothetical protein GGR57DRAFT_452614 [Xylariaceae sp. FL1272]|nr:hypothetical protein GGR57DRAFT_452614 [Xylariaceae sp. FL1272]